MTFEEIGLAGAFVVNVACIEDERGAFATTFDEAAFSRQGLSARIVQSNLSVNTRAGTLRGMHFQAAPYEQPKLVQCTQGAIYDVIIDLREDSQTRLKWYGVELSRANRRMLYIPAGFAHGFQTLEDHTEVYYQMFAPYAPESARGVRWNDPAFGIAWPETPHRIMNERDSTYPDVLA